MRLRTKIAMLIINTKFFKLTLTSWAPLLTICIILQVIPSSTYPWNARKSMPTPISYRLDTWSQYDNPEEGSGREGDIHENPSSRKTTTTDAQLLWRKGEVRYYVNSLIVNEPAKLAVLDDAIATIEESTCIKFRRIFPNNGHLPSSDWVNITGNQPGCFSDLGRASTSPNILNLDVRRCFRTRGHALHELLHTLGVYHEHMRPDRDQFINILWGNIKDRNIFNFHTLDKKIVTTYNLPYDYDSVMHYSMTAFSKDKSLPTIVPVKEHVDIGQRNHLSTQDVQKLMIAYKCQKFNETVKYAKMDQSHSDRLEILNLNSTTASIPKQQHADSVVNDYETPEIIQPSSNKNDNSAYSCHAIPFLTIVVNKRIIIYN